jgi:hypothetical protein
LDVWYDEYALTMGDSLLQSISKGLRECHFGIVVFSPNFFLKKWTITELEGLFARETVEKKLILPVWHKLGRDEILAEYPPFADRIASKSSDGVPRVVSDTCKAIQASRRTQEINSPIFSKLEELANKVATRERSDQLRDTREGIEMARGEVQRLFDLFANFFEPDKSKLGVEVVRDDGAASVMVRMLKFVVIDQGRGLQEMKKSRIVFRCEYPGYARNTVRDAWLKLYHYKEIYDVVGRFQEAQVITEWKMTPIFNAAEQVVWTNFDTVEQITSEELLEWKLSFFIDSVEKSVRYDR